MRLFFTSAALLGLPAAAMSQDSIFDIPEPEQETYVDVGAAVLIRPAYLGSSETQTSILPYISGEYKGRLFFDPSRGAGVHAIHKEKLQVSAYANLAGGRDAQDTGIFDRSELSDRFTEPTEIENAETEIENAEDVLDLNPSVLASASVRYRLKYALAEANVSVPVTGDIDGYRSELILTTKIPFEPIGLQIYPGVRASYTSSAWNKAYYGVDAEISDATGLTPFFETGNQVSVLGTYVLTTWEIPNMDINIVGVVNYNVLQNDLKNSPLVSDKDGITAVIGLAKKF